MNKRLMARSVGAAAVVAAIAGLGGIAAPAAGAASGDCGSGYLCAWWDSNYNGARYQFAGNNASWHSWAIADDDSSWYNHGTSGLRVQVYRDVNYVSSTVCLSMGQKIASNAGANNKGSSNLWNGC